MGEPTVEIQCLRARTVDCENGESFPYSQVSSVHDVDFSVSVAGRLGSKSRVSTPPLGSGLPFVQPPTNAVHAKKDLSVSDLDGPGIPPTVTPTHTARVRGAPESRDSKITFINWSRKIRVWWRTTRGRERWGKWSVCGPSPILLCRRSEYIWTQV